MDRDKNTTTITLTIVPQQSLEDVKIYESIPKCVAEYVHQAIFSNTDYEVLKQDPLIMWTFSSMQQHEQISYTVSKLLSKECLSLLNGLGIAKPKKVQKPAESIPNAHKASSRLLGLSAMLFAIILIARYFHLKK